MKRSRSLAVGCATCTRIITPIEKKCGRSPPSPVFLVHTVHISGIHDDSPERSILSPMERPIYRQRGRVNANAGWRCNHSLSVLVLPHASHSPDVWSAVEAVLPAPAQERRSSPAHATLPNSLKPRPHTQIRKVRCGKRRSEHWRVSCARHKRHTCIATQEVS